MGSYPTLLFFHPCTPPFSACSVPIIVSSARRCQGGAEKTKNHIDFYRRSMVKYHSRHKRRMDKRGWRNRQTRTFEGRVVIPCEFKSRSSHHRKDVTAVWRLFSFAFPENRLLPATCDVHKTANRHGRLHGCACSCILSRHLIVWS